MFQATTLLNKTELPKKDGETYYWQGYFACQAYLTVFGQLHAETYACMGDVYTFGLTFRVEKSHTRWLRLN